MTKRAVLVIVAGLLAAQSASAERVKDIVDIQGVRGNPIYGTGLVIGLAGSGDSSLPSRQMMTNILRRSGLVFSPSDLNAGNTAIVMVTAELGAFDHRDSRIDVTVSSVEDASSLQGGQLVATPLYGADGQVYAVASGPVSLGGFSASGKAASVTKNHQTVGRIPGGAIVEKEETATFVENIAGENYLSLNLANEDFTTAEHISRAINRLYPDCAAAMDAGTVRIRLPRGIGPREVAGFIDQVGSLQVQVDSPAVVVINERTGTIVVGRHVGISAVAISQGSLVVKIKETEYVSQPIAPFSNAGTTERVPDTMIGVEEREGHLIPIPEAVTVSDLARALNAIGATPRDLIAIFNALKKAGALQAKLEIM